MGSCWRQDALHGPAPHPLLTVNSTRFASLSRCRQCSLRLGPTPLSESRVPEPLLGAKAATSWKRMINVNERGWSGKKPEHRFFCYFALQKKNHKGWSSSVKQEPPAGSTDTEEEGTEAFASRPNPRGGGLFRYQPLYLESHPGPELLPCSPQEAAAHKQPCLKSLRLLPHPAEALLGADCPGEYNALIL